MTINCGLVIDHVYLLAVDDAATSGAVGSRLYFRMNPS
jgi:hypothetical protein